MDKDSFLLAVGTGYVIVLTSFWLLVIIVFHSFEKQRNGSIDEASAEEPLAPTVTPTVNGEEISDVKVALAENEKVVPLYVGDYVKILHARTDSQEVDVGKVFPIVEDDGSDTPYKVSGTQGNNWYRRAHLELYLCKDAVFFPLAEGVPQPMPKLEPRSVMLLGLIPSAEGVPQSMPNIEPKALGDKLQSDMRQDPRDSAEIWLDLSCSKGC